MQVSAVEEEARSRPRLDEGVVALPPAGVGKTTKELVREKSNGSKQLSIHKPGPSSNILIINMFARIKTVIKVRCNLQKP